MLRLRPLPDVCRNKFSVFFVLDPSQFDSRAPLATPWMVVPVSPQTEPTMRSMLGKPPLFMTNQACIIASPHMHRITIQIVILSLFVKIHPAVFYRMC